MSTAIIPVELPEPVLNEAARAAEKNGVSVATWIGATIAERLREEHLTAEFYRRRALGGDGAALLSILDKAPDVPPMEGDD